MTDSDLKNTKTPGFTSKPATPCVTGMYSNQLNYRTIDSRYFSLASAKLRLVFQLCNISAEKS